MPLPLLAEPFAWWIGDRDPGTLSSREVGVLRQFLAMGGVLLVDDSDPEKGDFGKAAPPRARTRRPRCRPAPDWHGTRRVPIILPPPAPRRAHLLAGKARSDRAQRTAQVLFTPNDLAGALAGSQGGMPSFPVTPGGEQQREMAVRLAVNLAMYVLCTNYKDDQVHAPS